MRALRRGFGLGARLALAFASLAALTALVTAGVSAYSTSRQVNADIDGFLEVRSLDVSEGRRADLPRSSGNRPSPGNRNNGDARQPADPTAAEEVIDDIRSLVESDAEVQLLSEDGNIVVTAGVALPVESIDLKFLDRFAFLLWGEGPHVSSFPVDILRVHSIMVYTDLIEYGIIGDTKAPILRCFPFISKIQNDSISTKQFMHYET